MKIWEDRAIELMKLNIPEFHVLDTLQNELEKAGILAGDKFVETRVSMAQQIIDNVKDK